MFQAHLPMFRPGIGSERRKQGDMFVMEAFHDGSGFGIGRAAVDPIAQKDEIIGGQVGRRLADGQARRPGRQGAGYGLGNFFCISRAG